MEAIAEKVYIETSYPGVTLGAIAFSHGLVMIDAPPRPDDTRAWRMALVNLGGGVDRMLVNLDSHLDRTLGTRGMECVVVAHDKTAQVFRSRPTAFKSQPAETGAEWEGLGAMGGVRWSPPEITLSHKLNIYWDDQPLILEHRPGPNPGAIWAVLPVAKIIFMGDAVVPCQPPFLASADIPAWIENLKSLRTSQYDGYQLISGRSGVVSLKDVGHQITYLKKINHQLEGLADRKVSIDATEAIIPGLLDELDFPESRRERFTVRLRWGLYHYYARRYRAVPLENEE
jgi:glyoxylase-like metal-dependent hydrolase (beta-lactamase superfamily II)